jgi:RNA polymerase sigma-70 factor (ECF subfamily)
VEAVVAAELSRQHPVAVVPAPRPALDDATDPAMDGVAAALIAARGGDADAFATIYRSVQPRLLRYARGLVGQDAEDVTAEAWLQIARDLRGFRGDAPELRAWTATVVRHRALDHLRRTARRPSEATDVAVLALRPGGPDPADECEQRSAAEAAVALIATLPRDQAEAVLLRVVVGLDPEAAAAVLGKRAGAVRVAAHRGLKRLAQRLQEPGGRDV